MVLTDSLLAPAQDLAGWWPLGKAAGFFLATFVLEDAAAVGAGLLLASGGISWPAAFLSCFLGIWFGDVGLYLLARFGGRRWFEKSSLKRFAPQVTQSERWFAQRGTAILIFSRMVPGTRLPTYLAAGFLRVPLRRFLPITGAASLVWTLIVLWLTRNLGARVLHGLEAYKHGSLVLVGIGLIAFLGLQLLRRKVARMDRRQWLAAWGRWRHWEFWPAWLFYPPVVLNYLWLGVRYRGFTLPTAANPAVFTGGFVGESKMVLLRDLLATTPEFTADSALISGGTFEERWAELSLARERLNVPYPYILKPDVGQRGVGVKQIRNEEEAAQQLRKVTAPLVLQRYSPGPFEAGVFYYRFPDQDRGHIFAITEKVFPEIIGDGRSTVEDLVYADPRARYMAAKYLARMDARRKEVLPAGVAIRLVEAGNHAQGCIFRDGQRLLTPELEARIDEISRQLTGFFIGRYDIRFASEEELRAGRNFQIIELNGATSEATSIYDARNSLWTAYRTLFRQWELVYQIGAQNRARGCAPTHPLVLWRKWREQCRDAAAFPIAD